ncbi:MAG: hypothetical protein NTX25_23085, partial [Proteobacteria bacterium]|nr:hypothetical protein [Pseudomonadota bacterium]
EVKSAAEKAAADKAAAEKANDSKTYVLNLGFMCTEMREAQTVKMTDQEKSKLVEGTCPKQIPLEFKGQKLTQTLLGYCKLSEDIKVAYYDKTVFVVLVEQTAEKAKTSCETPGDNGDSGVWLPL